MRGSMYGGTSNHPNRPSYEFRPKGIVHGNNMATTGLNTETSPSIASASNAQAKGQSSLRLVFSPLLDVA